MIKRHAIDIRPNHRVRHAMEPDMKATVLCTDAIESERVLVKWDGGCSQWVSVDLIRVIAPHAG